MQRYLGASGVYGVRKLILGAGMGEDVEVTTIFECGNQGAAVGITGLVEDDGGEVIETLLEQEACPRYVARTLLEYFEGVDPVLERVLEQL